jgi:general secretion pathway protein I
MHGLLKKVNNSGFTLIETLVAMMLISVTLVLIMQAFSSGLTSVNTSESYTIAIFHASEKMEELSLYKKLSPGIMTGTFNARYRWETEIKKTEISMNMMNDEKENIVQYDMFLIAVTVFWKSGSTEKDFKLITLRSIIY